MKICDLNTGLGQLAHAHAKLRDRMADVKEQWNDEALRQFEKDHLEELPARLQLLVTAVQHLAEILEQAERDCEEPKTG
jgi:hypothetical protein